MLHRLIPFGGKINDQVADTIDDAINDAHIQKALPGISAAQPANEGKGQRNDHPLGQHLADTISLRQLHALPLIAGQTADHGVKKVSAGMC